MIIILFNYFMCLHHFWWWLCILVGLSYFMLFFFFFVAFCLLIWLKMLFINKFSLHRIFNLALFMHIMNFYFCSKLMKESSVFEYVNKLFNCIPVFGVNSSVTNNLKHIHYTYTLILNICFATVLIHFFFISVSGNEVLLKI